MKKKVFFLSCAIALILAFMFDKEILNIIINNRVSFLNNFMIMVTHTGSFYGILFIGFLLFLYDKKWNNLAIYAAILFGSMFIALAIKYIILRPRPEVLTLLLKTTPSFPSTHAVASFCVYPLIEKFYPKLKNIWLVFAVLVLFSRIYIGVHYPTDVVFGAFLGYLIGAFVIGKFGGEAISR